MRLSGRVAIVTGGARGIGFACVERLLAEGAKVVIADIDQDAAELALREVRDAGQEALFVECDVGERLDTHNLVKATVDAYGAIDIVVNNAAITGGGSFLELREEDFERVLRTNLKGAYLVSQVAAREMIRQVEEGREPGCIINISGVAAISALPDQLAYCISKGALAQLTQAAALALAPHGIRVNAIGPGSVATDTLAAAVGRDANGRLAAQIPLGRLGEPREIAAIAAFLASADASYITGQTIYADGGSLTLQSKPDIERK
jgi:glucose 1-dehydrogenase